MNMPETKHGHHYIYLPVYERGGVPFESGLVQTYTLVVAWSLSRRSSQFVLTLHRTSSFLVIHVFTQLFSHWKLLRTDKYSKHGVMKRSLQYMVRARMYVGWTAWCNMVKQQKRVEYERQHSAIEVVGVGSIALLDAADDRKNTIAEVLEALKAVSHDVSDLAREEDRKGQYRDRTTGTKKDVLAIDNLPQAASLPALPQFNPHLDKAEEFTTDPRRRIDPNIALAILQSNTGKKSDSGPEGGHVVIQQPAVSALSFAQMAQQATVAQRRVPAVQGDPNVPNTLSRVIRVEGGDARVTDETMKQIKLAEAVRNQPGVRPTSQAGTAALSALSDAAVSGGGGGGGGDNEEVLKKDNQSESGAGKEATSSTDKLGAKVSGAAAPERAPTSVLDINRKLESSSAAEPSKALIDPTKVAPPKRPATHAELAASLESVQHELTTLDGLRTQSRGLEVADIVAMAQDSGLRPAPDLTEVEEEYMQVHHNPFLQQAYRGKVAAGRQSDDYLRTNHLHPHMQWVRGASAYHIGEYAKALECFGIQIKVRDG